MKVKFGQYFAADVWLRFKVESCSPRANYGKSQVKIKKLSNRPSSHPDYAGTGALYQDYQNTLLPRILLLTFLPLSLQLAVRLIVKAVHPPEEQGYISCGTCSYLELTEDHMLTSAYVKIFRIVTRNAVNKSF